LERVIVSVLYGSWVCCCRLCSHLVPVAVHHLTGIKVYHIDTIQMIIDNVYMPIIRYVYVDLFSSDILRLLVNLSPLLL